MKSDTERFVELMGRPESDVDLAEAALLIAAHAKPGLVVDEWLSRLDSIAATCPAADLDGLRRHLFETLGFRGNTTSYDDPRNSYLDDVLERRTGIPITLSLVAIEVGRRVGVPLVGVGLPGHFVVKHAAVPPVLLDPFGGGRQLDLDECAELVGRVYGQPVEITPDMVAEVGTFAMLARMLANLRQLFLATGDAVDAEWVVRLRVAIPGVDPAERLVLGRIQAALGRYDDAAATFDGAIAGLRGEERVRVESHALQARARLN